MKKYFNIILLFTISITSFAQINFEKGYFIDNNGRKINCLIKNVDWKNNPTFFLHKFSENGDVLKKTIEEVKEFAVQDGDVYKRFLVKMDMSLPQMNKLTKNKHPEYEKQTIFLKLLVDGDKKLYGYTGKNLYRYFYNRGSEVVQLVYKEYLLSNNIDTVKNEMYKQQIYNDVNCDKLPISFVNNIRYDEKSLTKIFLNNNLCFDGSKNVVEKKEKRNWFDFRTKLGAKNSNFEIKDGNRQAHLNQGVKFDSKINIKVGVEFEFILPYNNNKWSVVVDPSYNYFKADKVINANFETKQTVSVDYSSIEFPAGLRYRFFIDNNTNVFINLLYVYDFEINTLIDYEITNDVEIRSFQNFDLGIGVDVLNRLNVELRLSTGRGIVNANKKNGKYDSMSIILGYKLF